MQTFTTPSESARATADLGASTRDEDGLEPNCRLHSEVVFYAATD